MIGVFLPSTDHLADALDFVKVEGIFSGHGAVESRLQERRPTESAYRILNFWQLGKNQQFLYFINKVQL